MDIVNVLAALAMITLLVVLVLVVVRQVRVLRQCRSDAENNGTAFDWWGWVWPLLLWVPLLLGGIALLSLMIARRWNASGIVSAGATVPVQPSQPPARKSVTFAPTPSGTAPSGFGETIQGVRDQALTGAKGAYGAVKGGIVYIGEKAVAGAKGMGGMIGGVAKQAGQLAPPADALSIAIAGAALAFIVASAALGYMNTDGSMRPWLVLTTVCAGVATVAMYMRCSPSCEIMPRAETRYDTALSRDGSATPGASRQGTPLAVLDLVAPGAKTRQLEQQAAAQAPPRVFTSPERQQATQGRQYLADVFKEGVGESIEVSPDVRAPSEPMYTPSSQESPGVVSIPQASQVVTRSLPIRLDEGKLRPEFRSMYEIGQLNKKLPVYVENFAAMGENAPAMMM